MEIWTRRCYPILVTEPVTGTQLPWRCWIMDFIYIQYGNTLSLKLCKCHCIRDGIVIAEHRQMNWKLFTFLQDCDACTREVKTNANIGNGKIDLNLVQHFEIDFFKNQLLDGLSADLCMGNSIILTLSCRLRYRQANSEKLNKF